ncbi:MAG: SDR family oxidoreductase [Chloroflexi bacterium]|nr:SDR family oxidoreductase [Chloroflexota bacterium]
MKLVVIGATGGTGSQVVEQALAAGHMVTALVRRPIAVTLQHNRLEVIQGDVFEPVTLAQPISGQDGVVSALGITTAGPTTLFSTGIANIMQAMQSANVRRLICVSAGGLDPGPGLLRWMAKQVLWLMFKDAYTDMARMEAAVKASDLNWTIIRPPRLTDRPRTGQYHIAVNKHLARGWSISRADLADYIVTHLEDPQTYCAQVEVAH